MERNIDRKTLSFSKGMTNIPSDLLSDDTELVESDGFICRDGEMKPVQKPTMIGNIPYKIMYVHKGADYENIVAYDDDGNIYCYPKSSDGTYDTSKVQSFSVGKLYDIKSVGNTLICATENGLHYLLFKGGKYIDLGMELPKQTVYIKFDDSEIGDKISPAVIGSFCKKVECKTYHNSKNELCRVEYPKQNATVGSGSTMSIATDVIRTGDAESKISYDAIYVVNDASNPDNYNNFNDAIIGHVSGRINAAKEKNLFMFPFFLRSALLMFDGTYSRISNPIICYPTIHYNNDLYPTRMSVWGDEDYGISASSNNYLYNLLAKKIMVSTKIDGIEDWTDIIKGVTIFTSEQVCPFKIDGDWNFAYPNKMYNHPIYDFMDEDGVCSQKKYTFAITSSESFNSSIKYITDGLICTRILPTFKEEEAFVKELLSKSIFYKLLNISITENNLLNGDFFDATKKIEDSVCLNITEQEQLKVDDYYGWTSLVTKRMYPYNKRINLFDIIRTPFEGFNVFRANTIENSNQPKWVRYYVHIVSSGMDTWVCSEKLKTSNDKIYNDWYYYPDPNATEMIIECGTDENHGQTVPYYRIPLQEHPRLNGAYSFAQLPPSTIEKTTKPEMTFGGVEQIDSQIFTSVVNNPFIFEASGDNTIGTGKILEIAANTEPVSQGQFGQYPLLVFTSEGIYGMSVNSEGLYSASYPISREVCNDDSPMVPTDKLIFFVSKKGLMATSGGAVANMSELMRGRNPRNFADIEKESFLNFLNGCIIAYDYRDSLLRIYKNGYTYHYIYNMIDKTFGLVNDGIDVKAVVNNYPDNIVQDKDGNIYTLIGKPEINDDENTYSGCFVSRPLKLGGSINLKSIRDIKNLVDTDDGKITMEIWGSNDCKHWQKLTSLGGKPWKYFTLRYALSDFKAADSFAGSIVEFQTRRDDKMR